MSDDNNDPMLIQWQLPAATGLENREQLMLHNLSLMSDEERQDVFETMRMLYCMFCGKSHSNGRMCVCWERLESPEKEA